MAGFNWTKLLQTFIALADFDPDVTSVELGTERDVSGYDSGNIYIRYAPLQTNGSDPAPSFIVETIADDDLGDEWSETGLVVTVDTAPAVEQTLDGAANSAQRIIPLALTTNLTVGDQCYIRNIDAQTGEWFQIAEIITDTSITTVENLHNSYSGDATSDKIFTGAIKRNFPIDLKGVEKIRVLLTMFDAAGDPFVADARARFASEFTQV
jgi:hypothetical protein